MQVALAGVELRLIRLPLAEPFTTAHGTRTHREAVIVRALAAEGPDGWGECVAEPEPTYWPEYAAGAMHVLEHHLVPRLLGGRPLGEVQGHQMAKAALEGAAIDAGLRAEGRSLAAFLGATTDRVGTGIALGIAPTLDALAEAAGRWYDDGHRAFKLKVRPGWDVDAVHAVRKAVGDDAVLVADANGAYRSDDPDDVVRVVRLADPGLGVAALEQPYAAGDLVGHANLVRRVDALVCLDESIGSLADLDTALALGACQAVCLKVGRVGGLVEAARIHRRCREGGIDLRCGGMLETGLGRAVNLAVAAMPGCTLPADMAPSARYLREDLTPPFTATGGTMAVPTGPGLGVEPLAEILEAATVERRTLRAASP